jgi:hypothetical protein
LAIQPGDEVVPIPGACKWRRNVCPPAVVDTPRGIERDARESWRQGMATVKLTAENFEPVIDGGGLVLVDF